MSLNEAAENMLSLTMGIVLVKRRKVKSASHTGVFATVLARVNVPPK